MVVGASSVGETMINMESLFAEVYHDQIWDHDEICLKALNEKVCLKKHPKNTTFRSIQRMFGRD